MIELITLATATPYILAAAGAVFWFAYNHPISYNRVANFLSIAIAIIMGAAMCWDFGYSSGARAAFEAAKAGTSQEFTMSPLGTWGPITGFGASMFIFALRFIHQLKDK